MLYGGVEWQVSETNIWRYARVGFIGSNRKANNEKDLGKLEYFRLKNT